MKKKLLSVLLVVAMTATTLVGCGSTPEAPATVAEETETEAPATEEPANEEAPVASTEPVTISTVSMFGGTDANGPVYQAIAKEFMEKYPHVTIDDNSQVADEDWKASVAADFAVGNEPDVIQFFTDASANTIVATDKFVSIEEIKAVYPDYAKDTTEGALASTTNPDGVSRAIPTTGYWEGLFCNTDLFEQYKVELPTDWASLVTAIEVFKENGIIPIACSLNNVPHYWVEFLMLYAAGAEGFTQIPTEAPADWVKGLETFKTLRDMGAFPEDTDTVDDPYVGELFKTKKAAMQLDGSWYAGQVVEAGGAETTTVIAFPGIEGQKAEVGSMVAGLSSGFYITKKAWDDPLKRDAAVQYVMANTSKEAVQRYWEATGAIAKAATDVTPIADMNGLQKAAAEYTNAATALVLPTDARIDPEAYKIIISKIVGISTGKDSAEDVLNEALTLSAERQAAK